MAKNLVIVESPAKAKTIARFLGKDFTVKSSIGHIRDLPKKELGVDIAAGFRPVYQVDSDKKKVVKELKSATAGATVWMASDEDREGEAIAWHVCQVLGLNVAKTHRIVFHEITEAAISAALARPRVINMKLVEAQQARRILDRLVGYELSPVLWKKIRTGLSAGRVQSVATRLIVEREREIEAFKATSFFKVSFIFDVDGQELVAELPEKIADFAAAKSFLKTVSKSTFMVLSIEKKPASRSPAAPFTTSTLQQEASRKLGFSVKQTMTLAQRLYEEGQITYMRTDSVSLSNEAIEAAQKYITKQFGIKYFQKRQYKTQSQSAQEAHEAVRPTNLNKPSAGADSAQKKLYELIWRRALASQMTPAQLERTQVNISVSSSNKRLVASGEVLIFDGFLRVYGTSKEDRLLPKLDKGDQLKLTSISGLETYSRQPPRYSEATLVKKLEELGIGRPSTYAPTISVIQDRGYIEKKDIEGVERTLRQLTITKGKIEERSQKVNMGADRSKLAPTQLADIVTDFLMKHFAPIMDYDFTARAEAELDDIAQGELAWQDMLKQFYSHFRPLVEKSEQVSRAEATGARSLGRDPASGRPVLVRYGRYGPVLQLGEASKEKSSKTDKPRFAPLPPDTTLENITLKQALPMFELPRQVGKTASGELIMADVGPYGPYLKVNKESISIKEHNPLTITETEARKLIVAKRRAAKQRIIADYGQIKVLRGPYGPYVTNGSKNVRLPADVDIKEISEERSQQIITNAPKSRFKRRYSQKNLKRS